MDFTLSKEHEMARTLYREFAEKEVKPLAQELDTLIANLSAVRDAVREGDGERLSSLLRRGRLVKEALGE